MSQDTTQPRKEPEQERARFTFDAILEAAARILRADGHDQLTTNRIAEVAGVSVGSLYQYFPNKGAILARLIELELDRDLQHAREMFETFESLPLRESFQLLRAGMIERATQSQSLHEHLLPQLSSLDRERLVRRRVEETLGEFIAFLKTRPQELREELAGDPEALEAAAFLVFRAMETMLNSAKVERPHLLQHPILPDLVDELAALLLRPNGDQKR